MTALKNGIGMKSNKYAFGTSVNFNALKNNPFPCEMMATFDTSKKSDNTVTLRLVNLVPATKA